MTRWQRRRRFFFSDEYFEQWKYINFMFFIKERGGTEGKKIVAMNDDDKYASQRT